MMAVATPARCARWLGLTMILVLVAVAGRIATSAAQTTARGAAANSANRHLLIHPTRRDRVRQHARARLSLITTAPLTFGIYPGGAAGTVGPSGRLLAEDPVKRLAALEQLRPARRPFVLHLYASYSGPGGSSAEQQLGGQVAQYTSSGFEVELVLTYRPAGGGSTADVSAFAEFARATVRWLGSNPRFVSLQVTNEANIGGAPNASDGYYAGAKDALIAGVIAAKQTARSDGNTQVKVGFNWANSSDSGEPAFWQYLGSHGGRAFATSLDWVGLDAYPGTWGPPLGPGALSSATTAAVTAALSALRQRYMPLAGVPASVALHVSETGYPTGPGRTEAMQVTVMTAAASAVSSARAKYNVTDYRWFDLRDADSSSTSFESKYGLLRDDYTPKAGFAAYRDLVARLG
jgi:hypothetical protein